MNADKNRPVQASDQDKVRRILDAHGFVFEQKVIEAMKQAAAEAGKRGQFPWNFEASEFPVEVNGSPAHIDVLLVQRNRDAQAILVCECKRVDPARWKWCFFRTPFHPRGTTVDQYTNEYARFGGYGDSTALMASTGVSRPVEHPVYGLGLSLKTSGEDSDNSDSGNPRAAIEQACAQVCRGMNGFIEHLDSIWIEGTATAANAFIFPIIVTTAPLWVSDASLLEGDLATGKMTTKDLKLRQADCVYFRYVQSPGIKHQLAWTSKRVKKARLPGDDGTHRSLQDAFQFGADMTSEYVRTIPIVAATALKEFILGLQGVG